MPQGAKACFLLSDAGLLGRCADAYRRMGHLIRNAVDYKFFVRFEGNPGVVLSGWSSLFFNLNLP